jgi:signal-transduction protein with cAMP-binding, CBS, and nucleotidyltransferase domain
MKIRDVMTSNPRTVSPNDTIQAAARIMQSEDTGAFRRDRRPRARRRNGSRHRRAHRRRGGSSSPVSNIATGNVICASPEMSTRRRAS